MLLAPLLRAEEGRPHEQGAGSAAAKRLRRGCVVNGEKRVHRRPDWPRASPKLQGDVHIMIDRAVIQPGDEDLQFRLADSVQTAFFEGHGSWCRYVSLSVLRLATP